MEITSDVISLNGVEYVKKGADSSPELGDKRIIIADRGWVFAGDCTDNDDGTITIKNAYSIRRWGTTKGLGELINGPLAETIRDFYGTVRTTPIAQINIVKGW